MGQGVEPACAGERAALSTALALQAGAFDLPCADVPISEEQLAVDLRQAMKAREMSRVYVLRGVMAAIKNLKVERRGKPLEEADLVQVVRREMRKREEAEAFGVKAGRQDVVEQNRAERVVLDAYMPPALDPAELERTVREIVGDEAGSSLGRIMASLRERYAGRFDGKLASEIARRVLGERAGG